MEVLFSIFNNGVWYIYPFLPVIFLILVYIISLVKHIDIKIPTEKEIIGTDYQFRRISYKCDNSIRISLIFCISLVVSVGFTSLDAKYASYIERVLKMNNINIICTISMTFTAMVFAMAFVLILRERKYYLVFSLADVLERYNFFFWLKILFTSCILVCLLIILLLDGEITSYFDAIRFIILEICFVLNVVSCVLCFYTIAEIMFSSENRELKLLKQLYKIFDIANLDTTHIKKEWDDIVAIEINFKYLYEQYIFWGRRIGISNVSKVIFESFLDEEEKRKKAIKRARHKYIMFVVFLFMSGMLFRFVGDRGNDENTWVTISIVGCILDIIISYIPIDFIQIAMFRIFGDYQGYRFYDSKERTVTESSYRLRNRKYMMYTRAMNSLIAFMDIALKRTEQIEELNILLRKYIDNINEEFKTAVGLLPFWTIGYVMYILLYKEKSEGNTTEYNIDYLKELYKYLGLDKNQERDFRKMVYSQIYIIEKTKKLWTNKDNLKYMRWLCGN